MKPLLSSRRLFAASAVFILVVNVIVVVGAIGNRSGSPEAAIRLTERELPRIHTESRENSAMSLQLDWSVLDAASDNSVVGRWGSPAWFGVEKLRELGFREDAIANAGRRGPAYKHPVDKSAFIVLEYDGEAYREAVRRAEAALADAAAACADGCGEGPVRDRLEGAEKGLAHLQNAASRLFAIDAGRDANRLRAAYPDRSRFIITSGVVAIRGADQGKASGRINRLSVAAIHVPLQFKRILDAIPFRTTRHYRNASANPPRYAVELAYGGRREPWVQAVHRW